MSDKKIADEVWASVDERSLPESFYPALLEVARRVRQEEAQEWMKKMGGEYEAGVRDERQRIVAEIMKHAECKVFHVIGGEPTTCLDMVLYSLGVRRR